MLWNNHRKMFQFNPNPKILNNAELVSSTTIVNQNWGSFVRPKSNERCAVSIKLYKLFLLKFISCTVVNFILKIFWVLEANKFTCYIQHGVLVNGTNSTTNAKFERYAINCINCRQMEDLECCIWCISRQQTILKIILREPHGGEI